MCMNFISFSVGTNYIIPVYTYGSINSRDESSNYLRSLYNDTCPGCYKDGVTGRWDL